MKPEPLRVASPQFTRKRLMLRGLCDAFCVLKYGLYSPVTRCEPLNYRRWVKEKNRNSVLCARARAFSPVSPPLLLAAAWVSNAVGAMGGKLPDKSKKCPRLEPFAPPFFGRNDVVRAGAGGAVIVPLCSSVGPAARSSRFPIACALREVRGSRPNGTADAKSYSCECLRFFGLFLPFRERRSLFLHPLFLKSGQREGLFREK